MEGSRMSYESIALEQSIVVENIFSVHYFEYMSDFSFAGETHDFWEFLCVDKGTVNVMAGKTAHTLNKGDIIFHKPNEFHTVKANGIVAPNLVVISFQCNSPAILFFENKILSYGTAERELLAQIIREARTAFASRLDDPYCEKLIRAVNVPFAAEQLIGMYLQQLLISLLRNASVSTLPQLPKTTRQRNEDELFRRIVAYMEDHIDTSITLEQVCRDNLVGRSFLQKLFHEYTGCGVIDYFSNLKVNTAKQLIREQQMNFTQIAYTMGYNSIHYFSRKFKQVTGMTPSEYASSIKLLSEPGGVGKQSV